MENTNYKINKMNRKKFYVEQIQNNEVKETEAK